MSHALKKQLAATIRRLRVKRGLTQSALAKRAGVRTAFLARVERGEWDLTLESMLRIAAALGVGLDELFETRPDGQGRGGGPPRTRHFSPAARGQRKLLLNMIYLSI